ncbi:MAG: glycosyltransferase family 4 protein [Deltaproteobacteria bacterium]|nr:glycosyltransferase family 4 protein [Deltaproteobacteria bacterium]
MKIVFDHQIFTVQKFGGISRYFSELVKELSLLPDTHIGVYLIFSNNEYIGDTAHIKHMGFLKRYNFRGKARVMNFFNKVYSILKLSSTQYNVFHPTYYDPYFLSYIDKKPFVLTIHDMIHEKFPQFFSPRDKTPMQKRALAKRCSRIIVPSNSTKRDVVKILGIDESKIEVIYHGVVMEERKVGDLTPNSPPDLPEKYILYVGSRKGYKNFTRFLTATSYVIRQLKDIFVICIGGGKFTNLERKLMQQLNVADRVIHLEVKSDDLWIYYKNALMFVFPSLYEGFGLPILEAFACGCPVVLSDIQPFREIAVDAACYFDPESEESIKSAVLRVLEDAQLKASLIQAGKDRVKNFSWKQTAVKTREVYEKVI